MVQLKNVLVATDFGFASDAALECGRNVARSFGATLHVLHVVGDVYARGLESEPFEGWADRQRALERTGLESLNRRVPPENTKKWNERAVARVSDNAADVIVEFARETGADLIVMGTHGRDAVDPLDIGSVSAAVIHAAPCPVLTVKRTAGAPARSAVTRSTAKV